MRSARVSMLFLRFGVALLGASMMMCAPSPSADSVESQSDALTSIPNETAWARGTPWTYEHDFAGLPHAWVYRPRRSTGRHGVVIHLVGCGQLPFQVAQGAGWPEAAESAGLMIVVPEIIAPTHPNAVSPNVACYDFGVPFFEPTSSSPDHRALIAAGEKLAADPSVDPRQMYLAGFSAGATVAMQVACMAPHVFSGVISVAGPAMGTNQLSSVMPPTVTPYGVRERCLDYAGEHASALREQTYLLVSDDNGLPAGIPYFDVFTGTWTATKFARQTIWDGDKYVPFAHYGIIASAMAPLLDAGEPSSSGLPIQGTGIGCPGGEKSKGDGDETECEPSEAVTRPWQAKARVWKDARGLTRIMHLTQDTLFHRWPAGPVGEGDALKITPDRETLIRQGYMDASGLFNVDKINAAPNGTIGALYLGRNTLDLPKLAVELFAANNPKLLRESADEQASTK